MEGYNMAKLTQTQFNSTLKRIAKQGTNIAGWVQDCLMYSFDHYAKNGNTSFMAQVVDACNAGRSIAAKHVVAYIMEHANVRFVKITNVKGDDQHVFRKLEDSKKPAVTKPTVSVFEWKRANVQAQVVDSTSKIIILEKAIERAIEQDNCKDIDLARKHLAALRKIA